MIEPSTLNTLLGINESYEMPAKLLGILKDDKERIALFDSLIPYIDDFSIDVLRDYFQLEHSDRKTLKQDYTPDCACDLIGRISAVGEGERIRDVCAGSGALTIAQINKSKDNVFCADEVSSRVLPILILNLAIRNVNAYIRHVDVLKNEVAECYKLTAAQNYSDIEVTENTDIPKVDVIISNPPYSLKFDGVENFASDERFEKYGLPPKSKADYAFVLDGLHSLKEGGRAFYILPHGVLFRGQKEKEIRQKLIDDNLVDTLINLPENMFLDTGIPVFILVLKKNRVEKDILFIDASKGFEKIGKQNVLTEENIKKITAVYNHRLSVEKYSRCVSIDEIAKNDYNLNFPRYVDTSEEKEKIDIGELVADIIATQTEIAQTRQEIINTMGEMVCNDESEGAAFYDSVKAMQEYSCYDVKTLYDIGTVEKAKRGKLYPKGTIFIMLSGVNHTSLEENVRYCRKPATIERDSCAVIPDSKYNSYYIYQSILNVFGDFLDKYRTTINLQFDALENLKFPVHRKRATQDNIATELELRDAEIQREKAQRANLKALKEYMLANMFCGG